MLWLQAAFSADRLGGLARTLERTINDMLSMPSVYSGVSAQGLSMICAVVILVMLKTYSGARKRSELTTTLYGSCMDVSGFGANWLFFL